MGDSRLFGRTLNLTQVKSIGGYTELGPGKSAEVEIGQFPAKKGDVPHPVRRAHNIWLSMLTRAATGAAGLADKVQRSSRGSASESQMWATAESSSGSPYNSTGRDNLSAVPGEPD
jgi:hypothetical protein